MTAHDPIWLRDMRVRFLFDDTETAAALTMFEIAVPAGGFVPPPHSHDAFDETVYSLDGLITFTVAGERIVLGSGDSLFIPRGEVHGFVNMADEDSRFIAVATPGVFRPAYFEEIAAVLATTPDGPPDRAAITAVMAHHGLTPAPAPAGA
jgi:quercetin dioxygenase-like cupin family protein